MISRQPSRAALPHTATLWNLAGETVSGGGKEKRYQKTVVRYVRYESRRRVSMTQSGGTNADSLLLMIFNGPSVAMDEAGTFRRYVSPDEFLNAEKEEQAVLWTIQAGDVVGLGRIDGTISPGGSRARKDYRISGVDPIYGADGQIHHWEVTGA